MNSFTGAEKKIKGFKSVAELKKQLKIDTNIRCDNFEPVYILEKYLPIAGSRIRRLTKGEVQRYFGEVKEREIK